MILSWYLYLSGSLLERQCVKLDIWGSNPCFCKFHWNQSSGSRVITEEICKWIEWQTSGNLNTCIYVIKNKSERYSSNRLKRFLPDSISGALGLAKSYPSILISVFFTGFCYFSIKYYPIVTRLGTSRSRLYTSTKISKV